MTEVFSVFFFFKQKTAYEVRIRDWSSDVCSSDLPEYQTGGYRHEQVCYAQCSDQGRTRRFRHGTCRRRRLLRKCQRICPRPHPPGQGTAQAAQFGRLKAELTQAFNEPEGGRMEEHTSEIQSLMRNSLAVLCLKTKKDTYTLTMYKK